MSAPAAADAASLILFAPPAKPGDPPPLLLIERGATLAFAGGALAFPGGRIDPGDIALALALGAPDAAPRIAAIRETIEETGIAIGIVPAPAADVIASIRAGLGAGEPFGTLIAAAGLRLAPDALAPFARWLPPADVSRRYDTRFYIAELAAPSPPLPDGQETAAAFWMTAADALDGPHRMLFPTRRMLERIAALPDFATAREDAAGRPEQVVAPWIEERDGARWRCIPEGLGYPVTAARIPAADTPDD